jgi:hypothetical protein
MRNNNQQHFVIRHHFLNWTFFARFRIGVFNKREDPAECAVFEVHFSMADFGFESKQK